MTKVPEKRSDPCCICGEDHVESNCPRDVDNIAAFNDAVYEYIKDQKAFARDRKREKDDLDALLEDIRNKDVNEV